LPTVSFLRFIHFPSLTMRVRRRAFSPFSTAVLISAFKINTTPSREQREAIATAIGTTERRVQVWFQNRRQRESAGRACSESTAETDTEAKLMSSEAEVAPSPRLAAPPSGPDDASRPDNGAALDRVSEGWPTAGMKMEAFTTLYPPFEILWASNDWLDFCGFTDAEVVGQTLKVLQGPETDADALVALLDAVSRLDRINVTLTNYTRHGLPFTHTIAVEPLINSKGDAVLYRVTSSNVQLVHPQGVLPLALPTTVSSTQGPSMPNAPSANSAAEAPPSLATSRPASASHWDDVHNDQPPMPIEEVDYADAASAAPTRHGSLDSAFETEAAEAVDAAEAEEARKAAVAVAANNKMGMTTLGLPEPMSLVQARIEAPASSSALVV